MQRVPAHDRFFLEAIDYGRVAPFPAQAAEFTEAMTFIRDALLGIRDVEDSCERFTSEVNLAIGSGVFG